MKSEGLGQTTEVPKAPHPEASSPEDLARLVYLDELTSVFNRRYFNKALKELGKKGSNGKAPLVSLLMIDLDHFKEINDTHGHTEGDHLLIQTAALFQDCVAEKGVVVRYAGDEFAILLPQVGKSEATTLAEKILGTLTEEEMPRREGPGHLEVSLSIGVATMPGDAANPEKLLEEADAALYVAKKKGRGAVSVAGTIPASELADFKLTRGFPCPALVGRSEELKKFRASLPSRVGSQNRMLVVRGAAGSGKSRLLSTYFREARRKKRPVVLLVGEERDYQQPFHVAGRILRPLLQDEEGGADLTGLEDHHLAQIRWLLPDLPGGEADSRDDDPEAAAVTRRLPEGGWGPDFLLDAFEVLVNLRCRDRGLTLLFDDARWIDRESLRLLQHALVRRRASLLLAVTMPASPEGVQTVDSPGAESDENGSLAQIVSFSERNRFETGLQELELAPLPAHAVGSMCRSIFPGIAMAQDSAALIAEVTAGNPLYAEEVLKNLLGRERIVRAGNRWKMERITRDDIPASLEDAIRFQLKTLDNQTMEVIQNAAVIGCTFDLETLAEVTGRTEGEVREMVDRATDARILRPSGPEDGDELSFYSSTIHKVSESTLDADQSKSVHEKIARCAEKRDRRVLDLFVSRLAYHFGRSNNPEKAEFYTELSREVQSRLSFFEDLEGSTGLLDEAPADEPPTEAPARARRRIREGDTPLSESQLGLMGNVLRFLAAALKNRKMYPEGSRIIQQSLEDLFRAARIVFETVNVFTIADSPHGLVINGVVPDRRQLLGNGQEVLELLQHHHIKSITLTSQVSEAELRSFVEIMCHEIPENLALTSSFWDTVLDSHGISHLVVDQRVYVVAGEEPRKGPSGATATGHDAGAAAAGTPRRSPSCPGDAEIKKKVESLIQKQEPLILSEELRAELPAILDEMMHENREDRIEAVVNDIMLKMRSGSPQERLDSARFLKSIISDVDPAARTEMNRMVQDTIVQRIATEDDSATFRELAEILRTSVNDFVTKGEFESAARAVHALKRIRTRTGDSSPELTQEATRQLQEIADSSTFEVLLTDLVSGDAKRQGEALKILTSFGDIAVAPLLQVIRDRDDYRIRKYAAMILAEMGTAAVEAVKTKLSLGTPDAEFRRLIGILDALPGDFSQQLGEALKHPNKGVRSEAAAVINRIRGNIVDIFAQALDHEDPTVVAEAISQLGRLGRRDKLELIRAKMRHADHPELLHEACIALGRIGDPQVVPDLERVLNRARFLGMGRRYTEKVRYAAAWALGKIGTPEALEILRRAKRDRAAMVRNYVHEKLLGEEKLLADELLTADEEPGAGVAEDVVEKERDGIQAGS